MSAHTTARTGHPSQARMPGSALALAVVASLALGTAAPSAAADRIVYVSTRGIDSADGSTPATAVRTLARGFALAAGTPIALHVSAGRYEEPTLAPPAGTSVRGSWDFAFTKQEAFSERALHALKPEDPLCAAHTCLVATDADRTLVASNANVSLERLVVIGPDRSTVAGSNSFALVVQGVETRLTEVVVRAGTAGPGRGGDPGQPGNGICSGGGGEGWVQNIQTSGFSDVCLPHRGGTGDAISAYGRVAQGGTGGHEGESQCSKWPTAKNSNLDNGQPGKPGDPGIEGPPGGSVASDVGWLVRDLQGQLQWVSRTAPLTGQPGSAGGGGGGGGPGGSWNIIYWCLVGYPAVGGAGHQGNGGGCGGSGGGGGQPGGSASGIVVVDATVSARDVVVFGGQGGSGGVGGEGRKGSAGAQDDRVGGGGSTVHGCGTGPTRKAGTGASGGHGGAGGGGGGGAGGNGGPELAVVEGGNGLIEPAGVYRIVAGFPGAAGKGGASADSTTVAPSGNEGLTAKSIKLDIGK